MFEFGSLVQAARPRESAVRPPLGAPGCIPWLRNTTGVGKRFQRNPLPPSCSRYVEAAAAFGTGVRLWSDSPIGNEIVGVGPPSGCRIADISEKALAVAMPFAVRLAGLFIPTGQLGRVALEQAAHKREFAHDHIS